MAVIGGFLLGLMFFVEVAALLSFGYWGYHLDAGWMIRILTAIGLPVLVAIFWGMFVAPKASIPVSPPVCAALQIIVFALAAAALYFSGRTEWALIFGIVALIDWGLVYVLKL